MSAPPVYRELEEEIEETRRAKEAAIEAQEFEKAANLRDQERQLTSKKRELEDEWSSGEEGTRPEVGEEEIADIVSMWTGIPVFKLTEAETQEADRAWRTSCTSASSARTRRSTAVSQGDPPLARGHQGPEAARPARSSSSARPASARPSWRGRSPSSCSATRTR